MSETELLRVEVSVPLDADAAFALFVDDRPTWWPVGASLRPDQLGEVATWDPPRLVAFTWCPHGDAEGRVEVRTAPVHDDLTTVIVEHHLSGPAATDGFRRDLAGEQGWWAVLRAYAAAARTAD